MVETHTISAPEETWEQVFIYAKHQNISISDVTRQAWKEFFTERKNYRFIDLVILLMLVILTIMIIMGVLLF